MAREKYICLAREIKDYLEMHGEVLSATVIWSAYMVGRNKANAKPTVFFCSNGGDARKKRKKEVDESGILGRYPGFKPQTSNRPPHLTQLTQLAVTDPDHEPPAYEESPPIYMITTCCNPMGMAIDIRQDRRSTSKTLATIGVVLQSGDTTYLTTAGHAFEHNGSFQDFIIKEELELDLDESEDDLSDIDDESEYDFEHRITANFEADVLESLPKNAVSHQELVEMELPIRSMTDLPKFFTDDVIFSSSTGLNQSLDYCLIGLKPDDARISLESDSSMSAPCAYHKLQP